MIVGAGPAGLIAGYLLAQGGYQPLILERGRAVKERVADVRRFDQHGPLDPESNYLFGEGGAGTFSDGKLTSRSAGPDVTRVLEILAECHGGPSIVYEHRPHLGSNRLPLVVRTLRRKLESLGGEVRFSCRVEDFDIADGRLRGPRHVVGLYPRRPGHPRDRPQCPRYLRHAACAGACRWSKSRFSSACGSSSPRPRSTACAMAPAPATPRSAPPSTAHRCPPAARDLFTFCMCAGGYVMPSVSDPGYFCTNGMSESRHDSPFANSGLVVTIEPGETGGTHPLAGVHYQQRVERLAYLAAGRSYEAPLQWARDFLAGRKSRGKLPTSYRRGGQGIDLGLFLPELVDGSARERASEDGPPLRRPLPPRRHVDRPESRGSSPVRVIREPETRQSPGIAGLYPCGEGAGYAGGIISAAVDGLRTARAIVARHASTI